MTALPFVRRSKHVLTSVEARPRAAALDLDLGADQAAEVISRPDDHCAALLVEYATPSFPAEIVTGSSGTARLRPSGTASVRELLSLVERWLESAPLPSATVLYDGRSYLVRRRPSVGRLHGDSDAFPPDAA